MALSVAIEELVEKNEKNLLAKKESWQRIPVNQIAEILNGFAFKSSLFSKSNGGMPLIRIRDISKSVTDVNYTGEYDKIYLVSPGDILVGMDGDFNISIWKGEKGLLNQRVCKITVDETKFNKKLFFYLLPGYLQAIHNSTSSVTVKHLSSRDIARIPLPNPSLPEQELIVAEIEKQFTRLDSAIESMKTIKKKLKVYQRSILKAAFEGKENWVTNKITNLCEKIEQKDPKKENFKEFTYIDIASIDNSIKKVTNPTIIQSNVAPSRARQITNKGDIVYSSVRTYLKNIAIIPELQKPILSSTGFIVLRPKLLNNKLLFFFLLSDKINNAMATKQVGTSYPAIKKKDLLEYPISYPDEKSEQEKIVQELESQFSTIDKLEETIDTSLLKAETLRKSILKSAFEGKLVEVNRL